MPILITNAPRPAVTTALRRKGAVRSDGSRFTLAGETEAPPEAPAAAALLCPLALLQLQETPAPGPATGRAGALRHGAGLLDRLDELRLALLSGAVPPARLQALAAALSARCDGLDDPRLAALVADIELCCAVELAKFHRQIRSAPAQAADLGAVSLASSMT